LNFETRLVLPFQFLIGREKTTEVRGRRRRIVVVALAVLLVAIGIVAFWPEPKEPEYNGKSLSEWLWIARTKLNVDRQSLMAVLT
jgi:hypothetical protein